MKGTLPAWLERSLGLDTADSGEGTVWKLDYDWPWASWLTLVVVVALVSLVVYFYSREHGSMRRAMRALLIAIRLSLVGILCFMIAQFALSLERTGLPFLVVAIDDSASMSIADRYQDEELKSLVEQQARAGAFDRATRFNLAKSVLLADDARLLREAAERYKLRFYFVSDTARSESGDIAELTESIRKAEPVGQTSRLGAGVRSMLNDLRGAPPSALVLFSDGVNTNGEPLAEASTLARRKGVPIFTIGLGNDRPSRDLIISDLLVDDVVFVDDLVNFEFKLTGHGLAKERVEVVLRDKSELAPLAKATVTIAADGQPQKVRLPYRPTKVGEYEFVVAVEPIQGELQQDNNSQERIVSVRKEQIRVLMVQAYPNYEFRYLKHVLERDATIQVKVLLQEADPGYAGTDPSALKSFPVRREELFDYDVIVFGDVNPTLLGANAMRHLNEFVVEKGGAMVVIAGPRFMPSVYGETPLASLLPCVFDGASAGQASTATEAFSIVPTDLGLASPTMQLGDSIEESRRIWSELPGIYWMFEIAKLKPGVRVLAEHPARSLSDGEKLPMISLQYVGAGKVLFHAFDATWRWRYRVGDVFFARYWVQTIRYLSRSKLLGKDRSAELSSDRREYRQGEPVKLRVRFSDERQAPAEDDAVTVVLEQEGQPNQRLQLRRTTSSRGVFEGVAADLAEGRYHAWIAKPALEGAAPSVDFLIAPSHGEFEQIEMDAAALERVSAETKGRFFTLANVAQLERSLPRGRQVPIEALQPIVLWNKWPVLLVFLTLLVSEWILRRRAGMV